MDPLPPYPLGGGASALRLPPRGPAHRIKDPLSPTRRHAPAKVSPRHVKLQSVTTSLPLYATSTLRDQLDGRFRHDLFQLQQLLQDAVAQTTPRTINGLTSELQRSHAVFEVLTSDHHAAVLRAFFQQSQHLHTAATADDHDLLCHVVDVLFRNVPTILTEHDAQDASGLMRLVDALQALRELVLSLLYKTHDAPSPQTPKDPEEDDEVPTTAFASTSALLTALGRSGPASARQQPHESTVKRTPFYLHCQHLEHEIETLKRRLRSLRRASRAGVDDVGLLQEQTLALLVQFWELPKPERLAFFCQVASYAKQPDCDAVLRIFLPKCDTNYLVSVWDALHVTPSVQHALAMRKHGADAEAAAREAADAVATANRDVEERQHHKPPDDDDSSSENDEESGALEPRGRRGKRFAVAGRVGGQRPSQRVDLRGLTEGFEDDEEDDDDDHLGGGGDGDGNWGHTGRGGKRRRRKLRVRDRGHSPESQHPPAKAKRPHHRDSDAPRPDSTLRPPPTTKPPTPSLPILDRLHAMLLELLKGDDLDLDAGVSDAAWKLVETIDRTKRHDSIVPRGLSPRKLSTFQQHPTLPNATPAVAMSPAVRLPHRDPLGSNLTTEQQYFVKLDQLQSLLTSLGSFTLDAMTPDAISSAYKRLPPLHRLFQATQQKIYDAVGLDPVAPSPTVPAASASSPVVTQTITETMTLAPPTWADENMMESVEVMLQKLGKMVRSLAPIADVGGSAMTPSAASSEILKLADTMEEIASSNHDASASSGGARRHLSLDPARRMAMLHRLKALAQGNDIESLTGLLSTTCDDLVALKAVTDHQQRQLQDFGEADNDNDGDAIDESGGGNGDVDDVLKLVKKAKIRRASAAKTAAITIATAARDDNGSDDGGDDDQSLLMNVMTAPRYANRMDIPLTIKQATAQRGSKLFNAGILLRVVDQMYRENYETMVASLQYGSRRMEFSEFMYDWHIRKYGLKSLAQQHLLKLIQSLRKHERKVFQCHLCLRFLGIVSPLGFHEHKFVLGLLDKWSGGTFSGAAKHRVEFLPRQFKVRIAFAIPTLQEALTERFGVYFRTMDAVTSRIKALAMRQDDEFIKESDLLTVALDEWQAQRQRIEQILEAVYTAGDLNGDGSLEYDEFSAVMLHLSPALTDKFVQRVFTAAHDYLKPRRISFARFLDVVLLERVLNTSASTKTKATVSDRSTVSTIAAPSALSASAANTTAPRTTVTSADDEEMYQFNLLQETWENDRDGVVQALSAIPHPQTVASIQFRVSFLTQILSKRVDSKTAWMCHRQIMRDIRRYQNLNGDQIVAVKTKEETFKKAVMAIRNLQRLSVAFRRPTAAVTTDAQDAATTEEHTVVVSETEAPRRPSADLFQKQTSYVSVVEGAVDHGKASSLVEMEALENQIREKFLERADEGAIDDFKNALLTLRRLSSVLTVMQEPANVSGRGTDGKEESARLGDVLEEGDEADEDEDEDDEQDQDQDEQDGGNEAKESL